MSNLTVTELKQAVTGEVAAIRRVSKLSPAGGEGDKLFPPTYEGGEYAVEDRKVRGHDGSISTISTVLLDSVQSQANRLELALLRGFNCGRLKFPLLIVDFAKDEQRAALRDIGRISTLEVPHRVADAIFRDAVLDGTPFRESTLGQKLDEARPTNATPMFEICPLALVFGIWDSTGPKGGSGTKFQRALVSEIIGYNVLPGVRSSSRVDPLQIEKEGVSIYKKHGGSWTTDASQSEIKDGNPVKWGKEGKPSEINHGNITPSLRDKNGKLNPGGFTIAYAVHTTVLSLAALRRLRFPLVGASKSNQTEIDQAAQTVLAALGLAAICWQDREGYDLRSRCLLDGKPAAFEFVGRGESHSFELDADSSAELLSKAAGEATRLGLPWPIDPTVLLPSEELKKLILKSREKSVAVVAD